MLTLLFAMPVDKRTKAPLVLAAVWALGACTGQNPDVGADAGASGGVRGDATPGGTGQGGGGSGGGAGGQGASGGAGLDLGTAGTVNPADAAVGGQIVPPDQGMADSDGDSLVDALDNCPAQPNREQADADGDGQGDVCDRCPQGGSDLDLDGDGVLACAGDCDDTDPRRYPGSVERCDAIDNNCDNNVDEGFTDLGSACSRGQGLCRHDGSFICADDGLTLRCSANDGEPLPEVCDDQDNDCDGAVDDGLSVPGVYATIQSAINASSSGQHVCVATGEYNEDLDFGSRSITVEGMDGSDYTVIAGTGTGTVVTISSGTPTLRGFTIKGGDGGSGAGMYVYGADAVLDDLVISGNTCSEEFCYGVGAQLNYANVTATDVVISGNSATPALGTSSYVYVTGVGLSLTGCTGSWEGLEVSGNSATSPTLAASQYAYLYGTGVYLSSDASSYVDMVVEDNTASRAGASTSSYAYAYGGGMYAGYGSSTFDGLTVQSNTISTLGYYDQGQGAGLHLSQDTSSYEHLDVRGNVLDTFYGVGGGMYMGYYSTPSITNAIIAGNKVGFSSTATNYAHGAGIATGEYAVPVLENVDIYGNKGVGEYASGGGIYLYYYGGVVTNNVAVAGNTLTYTVSGGGGALGMYSPSYLSSYSFTNSNFYGNTAGEFSGITTVVGSSGNIGVFPGYTSVSGSDPTAWNLLLSATSAMQNVGDSTLSDVDGTRSDIGAYGGPSGAW